MFFNFNKEPELEPIKPSNFGPIMHGMAIALFFPICSFFFNNHPEQFDNVFSSISVALLSYFAAAIVSAVLFSVSSIVCNMMFNENTTERQRKVRKITAAITYLIIIVSTGVVYHMATV